MNVRRERTSTRTGMMENRMKRRIRITLHLRWRSQRQLWRKASPALFRSPITSDRVVIPSGYNEQSNLYSEWESRSQHPGRRRSFDSLANPQLTPVIFPESHRHLFGFDPIRHPAKHSIEYLMRKIHGFLNRGAGRDHADIDLLLSRKPQPGDNAGTQVDQRSIHSRHRCEGVPHPDSIGEEKANIIGNWECAGEGPRSWIPQRECWVLATRGLRAVLKW